MAVSGASVNSAKSSDVIVREEGVFGKNFISARENQHGQMASNKFLFF